MKAFLILEDGTVLTGESFGAAREVISEVVFNTSMTGYQEVLTDPSYYGQIVTMTYPLVGNYGINLEDMESNKSHVKGFIVREKSNDPNNFRCEMDLDTYLKQNKVIGLEGIDTRALTKILRNNGTMKGIITLENASLEDVKSKLEAFTNTEAVRTVTRKEIEHIKGEGAKVAVMDFGVKQNILRSFAKRNCDITVFPATTKPEEILGINPDLIFLSNGPGDPKECTEIIKEIRKLYDSQVPIFAICLGHQLMALATGADTKKMKYGHRGGNHPVKDLETGRVYISSQNHGYVVDTETLDPKIAVPAFENVNDKTNEGLRYVGKNIFTVQFHPEACPGPQDSGYLFDRFIKMMEVTE